jgi:hypothetical protein
VQEYFFFAFDVVAGLRGINDPMEQELDKLLRERDLLTIETIFTGSRGTPNH